MADNRPPLESFIIKENDNEQAVDTRPPLESFIIKENDDTKRSNDNRPPLESFVTAVDTEETKQLENYARDFTFSGAAEQFATGTLNQMLLGFPEYMIKKHLPLGEEIWKNMESPIEAERVARGIGSFLGFVKGAPAGLLKIGGQTGGKILQTMVGAKKVNRFVMAAAKGASSFALYETLKAPEEDFGEKVKTVPLNMAIGAVLGFAGEKLSTAIKIRTLNNAKALASEDGNSVLESIRKKTILNNDILTSESRYLDRQGGEGTVISKLMQRTRDVSELKRNAAIVDYNKAVKGLSLQEKLNFTEVLEGKALPLDGKVGKVVSQWDNVKGFIETQLSGLDLKVRTSEGLQNFKAIENYFPHLIIPTDSHPKVVSQVLTAAVKRGDFKDMTEALESWNGYKEFIESGKQSSMLIKSLINSGKAKTKEEAEKLLLGYASKIKQSRFGNLEFAREINLPFYDVNPDRVMPRYFDGIFERIEQIKAFGQNNEVGKELVAKMKEKGLDWRNSETAINRFLGVGEETSALGISEGTLAKVRNYNTATKLGLAVIPNSTQGINTYITTGLKHTAKGIAKAFTNEGIEFAQRSTNVLENSMHDITSEITQSRGLWANRILKWTGFTAVERFNRIVSANAARSYSESLTKQLLKNPFDKLAKRGLQQMGLNPAKMIEQGGMTFEDTLRAAQQLTNKTQFRAAVQDLPLFWTSPEGKVLTQFKNFSFNQTKFIKDAILQEAARGNLRPMIRAVSLAPILGEGVNDIRAILSGKSRDKAGLERIAENMAAVGGLGIISDLWQSASYGKFGGALLGPTGSTLSDFAEGLVQTIMGKPNKLVRTTVKQVPVAGPLLSNLLKNR